MEGGEFNMVKENPYLGIAKRDAKELSDSLKKGTTITAFGKMYEVPDYCGHDISIMREDDAKDGKDDTRERQALDDLAGCGW